jgi:hypothetical protein
VSEWKLVFFPDKERVGDLLDFLEARLRREYRFRLGHGCRVIIEDLMSKDDAWKVAEWVRNQGPLGKELRYQIVGYDGLRVSYLSYCPKCRSGVSRHYEHSGEKVP